MRPIKTVLCPIDFSDLARRELALAVEVCETFGAELVIHHNRSSLAMGFARAWEWNEADRREGAAEAKAEERLRDVLAGVPKTVNATARVSDGPLGLVLLEMARQLPADLIVIGSHGWSTLDHASITERIIDECPCPALTLHEDVSPAGFRMRTSENAEPPQVVVPTDFTASGQAALDYAFALARRTSIHLHVLHVVSRGNDQRLDAAWRALTSVVPPDLVGRTLCHVEQGDAIERILSLTRRVNATFTVMGEHARPFFARLFTRDTAQQMLHRANCPVWFVPCAPAETERASFALLAEN